MSLPGARMTPESLALRVNRIISHAPDGERAHAEEDELRFEVIARFCPEWVVAEIERLSDADFARWCA
jgi:hypothetical protein